MIHRPTRVSGISATILGHIWTTDLNVKCREIVRICTTDHYSVSVVSNISSNNQPNDNSLVTCRNFSEKKINKNSGKC